VRNTRICVLFVTQTGCLSRSSGALWPAQRNRLIGSTGSRALGKQSGYTNDLVRISRLCAPTPDGAVVRSVRT
jgi:hypothetical protein